MAGQGSVSVEGCPSARGRWGLAPMGFLTPTGQVQESTACTGLLRSPQTKRGCLWVLETKPPEGRTRLTSPSFAGSCRRMSPQGGAQEPQTSSSGFHGAICGAGDRELSTGRPCPLPAHLAGLPHQETHVSMSAPPEAHRRPPHLSGPGHYRPLLAPGSSCTLYSVGGHSTARERS